MKIKKIRLAAILLVMVMLVSGVLTGCSNKQDYDEDDSSSEEVEMIDPYDLYEDHWKENGKFKWGADNHFELEAYLKACGFKKVATVSDGSTYDEIAVVGYLNGWRIEIPLNSSEANKSFMKITGEKGKEAFCTQLRSINVNNLVSNWNQEGYFVTINGNGDKVHQANLKILPDIISELMDSEYSGTSPFSNENLPEGIEQNLNPPSY